MNSSRGNENEDRVKQKGNRVVKITKQSSSSVYSTSSNTNPKSQSSVQHSSRENENEDTNTARNSREEQMVILIWLEIVVRNI